MGAEKVVFFFYLICDLTVDVLKYIDLFGFLLGFCLYECHLGRLPCDCLEEILFAIWYF